jgi:hypothetical protein
VKGFAHVDAARDELPARRLDVGHHQVGVLHRARHGRRDPLAELDRAGRTWRRHLHAAPGIAVDEISVEPPTQALVKALGAIDI